MYWHGFHHLETCFHLRRFDDDSKEVFKNGRNDDPRSIGTLLEYRCADAKPFLFVASGPSESAAAPFERREGAAWFLEKVNDSDKQPVKRRNTLQFTRLWTQIGNTEMTDIVFIKCWS